MRPLLFLGLGASAWGQILMPLMGPSAPNGYSHEYQLTIKTGQVPSVQTGLALSVCTNGSNGCNLSVPSLAGEFTSSSCYDAVWYADVAGTTKLNFELVPGTCNASSGIAEWWVQPSNVTAGMSIYLLIGKSSVTTNQGWPTTGSSPWDSNFVSVFHFPNGTTLSGADSTGNTN